MGVTPESCSERKPRATGAVIRENSDTSVALTVTLDRNDEREAIVPTSVKILAGEAAVDFKRTPMKSRIV